MKFLLILAALVGGVAVAAQAAATKEWTVLVYMAADNDLEEAALDDLNEMLQAAPSDSVQVVVQVDRSADDTDAPVGGIGDWVGTKRLAVQKGRLVALADLGAQDTGNPRVLADFVAWGLKTYPAQRTALVFWDHGGGRAGFGYDEGAGGTSLGLGDLGRALASGLKAAGTTRRLDLVGFDACLMAGYETARALAPSARYLLASEELEPGFGWDWRALAVLSKTPAPAADTVGKAFLDAYSRYCKTHEEGAQFTLSLVDLDKLGPIEAALTALDGAAAPRIAALGGEFGGARFRSVEFGKSGDPAEDAQMVDLGDLARAWQSVKGLEAGARALSAAVAGAVVDRRNGSVQGAATGLSIWFPSAQASYEDSYRADAPPSWVHLLGRYYAAGAALPPEERAGGAPEPEADTNGVTFENGQVTFTRDFDPKVIKNTTTATLYYGTLVGGKAQILGSRGADFDRHSGRVTGQWDLSGLTVVQGKTAVPVYLAEDGTDTEHLSFSVPFSYYADGRVNKPRSKQPLWLAVTVELKTNTIVEETFYQETEGDLVGEFRPAPGSRIVAKVLEPAASGDWEFVDRGAPLDPQKPLDYEFRDLDPDGEFYLSLDISDYGANDDSQEYEGPLP